MMLLMMVMMDDYCKIDYVSGTDGLRGPCSLAHLLALSLLSSC
jgi:hypothetical protein